MWRQGDVLIERVDTIPHDATRLKRLVLATGDSTGQRHMIKDRKTADLFSGPGDELFLRVTADGATIAHPEHGPIILPRGEYRVWKQREFTDQRPRPVFD
jgi:hypothetical protein